jgi:hypothetical protein
MTLGGITRTVALWVMMICAGIATGLLWWQGQTVWAVFWSIIIGLVILFELYGILISKEKKTISNMWKAWAIKAPSWAYFTLALLYVSLTALCLHLAVW